MGLFDALMDAGRSTGGLLSGAVGKLTNMQPDQSRFMLDMGMNMLANQDPTRPIGAMQSLGAGYGKARESQRDRRRDQMEEDQYQQSGQMRQMQHTTAQANLVKLNQRNEAMTRITEGFKADPNFKPSMGDLILADPDSAFRLMAPQQGNEFGLNSKVGTNPETGEDEYFAQDRLGNKKWLGIKAPKNYRFIPGNDYRDPQIFDPRNGGVQSPSATTGGAMPPPISGMGGPGSMARSPAQQAPFPGSAAPAEIDVEAPWAQLRSPREQDDMKKRVYEMDSKRLAEMNDAIRSGRATLTDLNRFGELNQQTGTGGFDDRLGLPSFSDNKQEMEAITARLVPRQRPPGSGSTSDFDAKMHLSALPSVAKDGPANKQIREGYEKSLNEAVKEKEFYEQYFLQRGHLKGADRAYAQQLERETAEAEAKKNPRRPQPPASAAGSWPQINAKYAAGAGQRRDTQIEVLQDELSRTTNPADREAIQRDINRAQGQRPAPQARSQGAPGGSKNAGGQTMTLADIAETARRSGRSTAEVTKRAREKGFTIVGQ